MNQDLSGLPVKCPNCKKILFKTTDKYDPNVSPRGDMLKSLVTYHLDFLLTSSTPVSSLTCPECLSPLARNGRLHVITPDDFVITGLFSLYIPVVDMSLGAGDLIPIPQFLIDMGFSSLFSRVIGEEPFIEYLESPVSKIPNWKSNIAEEAAKPQGDQNGANEAAPATKFICDVAGCGKECKSQFGLDSHKRSHK